MGVGNLLKYFTRTHQVVEEEDVEHTERWKDSELNRAARAVQ